MESSEQGSSRSKGSNRRGSKSHLSMSDTDSTASQIDSWHSPLRLESPFRSDDPSFQLENGSSLSKNLKPLASMDKCVSPVPSPGKSNFVDGSPNAWAKGWRPWPHSDKPVYENRDLPISENRDLEEKGASPVVLGFNRPPHGVKKAGAEKGYGGVGLKNDVGGDRGSRPELESVLRRPERSWAVIKSALVLRVLEVIFCLVSLSVMAANKTRGWSGDSFDRYIEYRYCLAVNAIGFVYSGFQACDLAYNLGSGKHVVSHHRRRHFDFLMDQILAYLLMSASSSAATRVNDWISNWGSDKFTLMASSSISLSFLAFGAFALSSLISGYNLWNRDST